MSIIETNRLHLRPFEEADGPGLYAYLCDENVVQFEPYGVFSEEAARSEAAKRALNPAFIAVCLRGTGELIGNIYFAGQDYDTWELGYVFNPRFWGSGYATEAARAVMDESFRQRNARRITANCDPLNERSWKLLERLGFRREGCLRQNVYFKTDGQGNPIWKDTYQYGLLREEWRF